MSATDKVFAGSVPKLYDEYLVPLIFSVYADDLARRIAALSPSDLLEIAAGTGAVTRAVAALLPSGVRYVATDLNEPMLAVARQRQGDDPRMSWRQADALTLPFDDAAMADRLNTNTVREMCRIKRIVEEAAATARDPGVALR